jgi:hypothetical protein
MKISQGPPNKTRLMLRWQTPTSLSTIVFLVVYCVKAASENSFAHLEGFRADFSPA